MEELASAVKELKTASTPTEKREASAEVQSAEAALEQYARAHGVSVEDAEEAINQIKRNSRKAEMRELMEEIFQEDEEKAAKDEEEAKLKAEEDAGKEKEKETPKPKPKEDAAPGGVEHWSERRIFSGS
jgi:hypothetical protein